MALLKGFKVKKRSKEDEAVLQDFLGKLESARRGHAELMERVRSNRAVVNGTTNAEHASNRDPDDPLDWKARFFPKIVKEKYRLLNAEMSVERPRFDFEPRRLEDKELVQMAEDVVDEFMDRDHFSEKFRRATAVANKDGGCVLKSVFSVKKQPMIGRDGSPLADDEGNIQYLDPEECVRNIIVPWEKCLPDPTARSFRDASFVIHEFELTTAELLSRRDSNGDPLYDVDAIKRLHDWGKSTGEEKREGETEESFQRRRAGIHVCHEMWARSGKVVIADEREVIYQDSLHREVPIPFTMIRSIEHENMILGESPFEDTREIQEAYWRIFNDTFDAVAYALNPPKLVNTELDPDAAEIEWYPGANIETVDGESVVQVFQDMTSLHQYKGYEMLVQMESLIDSITGMNSELAGDSSATTATQSSINIRQAKGRVQQMVETSDDCWARVADKVFDLTRQYASEDVVVRAIDGSLTTINPMELRDLRVKIQPVRLSSERVLTDLERQDNMMLLETLLGFVDPSQMPSINIEELLKDVVRSFGHKPRRLIAPQQPAPVDVAPVDSGQMQLETDIILDEEGNEVSDAGFTPEELDFIRGQQGE